MMGQEDLEKGLDDFLESLSDCRSCLVKFALEIADSTDQRDREALKKILKRLAEQEIREEGSEEEFVPFLISRKPLIDLIDGKPIILPRLRRRVGRWP
jgi:hypothetical protein